MELSPQEISLLLHSVYVCTPSGGGSPQFTLFRKLREQLAPDFEYDLEELGRLAGVVISDAREAGAL